jgi:hypothetical protein
VALVEELVEAHLDTIETRLEFDHEWGSHVLYLQELVRESHECLAALGGQVGADRSRGLRFASVSPAAGTRGMRKGDV